MSTMTVNAASSRILDDSLVDQTCIRRQVGAPAANDVDELVGEIRSARCRHRSAVVWGIRDDLRPGVR